MAQNFDDKVAVISGGARVMIGDRDSELLVDREKALGSDHCTTATIDVDLTGVFFSVKQEVRQMLAGGGGGALRHRVDGPSVHPEIAVTAAH
jgi:hypothetical protein